MAAPREPVVVLEPKSPPRISMRLELSAQPGERGRWALIILGVTAGFALTVGGAYRMIEQERKPIAEIVYQRDVPELSIPATTVPPASRAPSLGEVPELGVPATAVPPASQAPVSAAPPDQPAKLVVGLLPPVIVTPEPAPTPPSSLASQPDPKAKASARSLRIAKPPRQAAGQVKF